MSNEQQNTEFKNFSLSECKLLSSEDPEYFYFEGYLSTYGNVDRDNDYFTKGAFDESLQTMQPDLRWMHKTTEVIGVFEFLSSDEKGLRVKGKLPKSDTLVNGRVIPQIKVGSVRSMSVGFAALEWNRDDKGCRRITKAALIEGSLVSIPANPEAKLTSFKSYSYDDVKDIKTKRDAEKILRDSGFSNKSASFLASKMQLEEIAPEETEEKTAQGDLDSGLISELAAELKNFNQTIKELSR